MASTWTVWQYCRWNGGTRSGSTITSCPSSRGEAAKRSLRPRRSRRATACASVGADAAPRGCVLRRSFEELLSARGNSCDAVPVLEGRLRIPMAAKSLTPIERLDLLERAEKILGRKKIAEGLKV